jgi:hypothetical protein
MNKKINLTDKVVANVIGEGYERYESGGLFNLIYKGSWKNVLNKISKNHSYGAKVGFDEEDGCEYGENDVIENIDCCNGDGCDFITYFSVKRVEDGYEEVLIDEKDFVEEEIDCD